MSSPRGALPADATVHRENRPVGALLLPEKDRHSFVEQFNRIYHRIGLSVRMIESSHTEAALFTTV